MGLCASFMARLNACLFRQWKIPHEHPGGVSQLIACRHGAYVQVALRERNFDLIGGLQVDIRSYELSELLDTVAQIVQVIPCRL